MNDTWKPLKGGDRWTSGGHEYEAVDSPADCSKEHGLVDFHYRRDDGETTCPVCYHEVVPVPKMVLYDAVNRQRSIGTWQPIETAPKDADVLLLYLDGKGVQPGYWDDDYWGDKIGRWLACETQSLTGGQWHAEPTHWMPLPDPPTS